MDEIDPNHHADPEVSDEHKVVGELLVAQQHSDEVFSMSLEESSGSSFKYVGLAVHQLRLSKLVECLLLDAADIGYCVI